MALIFKEIDEDFHIKFDLEKSSLHLSPWQTSEVNRIWEEQQKLRLLFDGLLFSVQSVEENCLHGHWVDYRYMIAQRYSPALQPVLKIVPLGISAFTTCGNLVLVGKRADHVANYPGCYECAPSGGVDPSTVSGTEVDLLKLISKELEEEVGIHHHDVESVKLILLCYDTVLNTYELISRIVLKGEAMQKIAPSEEYPEIFWLPREEINAFLNLHQDTIIPLSRQLLKNQENYFETHLNTSVRKAP